MSVRVELRKGGLEAVAVWGPGPIDPQSAASTVMDSLRQLGLPRLPDRAAVAQALAAATANEAVVAVGTPPQPGINAMLLPAFPIKDTPMGEGVDPFEAYARNLAYPGDVVLRKTPSSPGIPGETLLGAPLAAKEGMDVTVICAGGVSEDVTGLIFRSSTYGVVTFQKTRIGVAEAIHLTEDRMEARLTVLPDPALDEAAHLDRLLGVLKEFDIVRGIYRDLLLSAVRKTRETGRPVRDVPVARGAPAVDGQEADYRITIDLERKAFKALEGSRVDYRETDTVKNVKQGDVLAEALPAQKPEPGFRLDGSAIPPRILHAQGIKPGDGTTLSADGRSLVAAIDGMVVVKAGKINVMGEYDLSGDVDINTGNIRAAGSVKVRGTVQSGFVVDAGRDVEIGGDVWEARIESGGNVKVIGAITSGSTVTAKGNVSARFIQNSHVECQGDIDVMLNVTASQIYAKGTLRVMGSQGLILGGEINAATGMEAKTIGSLSARTAVAVGLDIRVVREIEEIKRFLSSSQEELQRLQLSLGREFLKDPKAALLALPPVMRKTKLDVLMLMKGLQEKGKASTARLEELNALVNEQKDARILVHGEIFAGTVVSIGRVKSTLSDTLRRVVIHYDPDHNCVAWRKM